MLIPIPISFIIAKINFRPNLNSQNYNRSQIYAARFHAEVIANLLCGIIIGAMMVYTWYIYIPQLVGVHCPNAVGKHVLVTYLKFYATLTGYVQHRIEDC